MTTNVQTNKNETPGEMRSSDSPGPMMYSTIADSDQLDSGIKALLQGGVKYNAQPHHIEYFIGMTTKHLQKTNLMHHCSSIVRLQSNSEQNTSENHDSPDKIPPYRLKDTVSVPVKYSFVRVTGQVVLNGTASFDHTIKEYVPVPETSKNLLTKKVDYKNMWKVMLHFVKASMSSSQLKESSYSNNN